MDGTAPGLVERDELDPALAFTHVPKIRLAPFKLCFGPGRPDAVMMEMIQRVVVGDEFAAGRENGVKVTAALEDRFDVRPRQFAHFCLIMKSGLVGDGALDPASVAGHLHAVAETGVRFGRNPTIRPGGTMLQFFFDDAGTAFRVGLKRNPVAAFVGELLEFARAGGQCKPDDGIASVVFAGKNGDPAGAFRGMEAEGTAEQQECDGGRNFWHNPFCGVRDRSSSPSAAKESGVEIREGESGRRDRESRFENRRVWWVGWDSNPRPTA